MMKLTKKTRLIAGLCLLLALACALMMSGSLANYRAQRIIANEVDYTNTLADSFMLLDKPVVQQEDGSYQLDNSADAQPTSGFTYKLIPGVTIPAAPYIEITNKTVIPAYLYLEVENTGSAQLSFHDDWTELSGVTGKKGGTVYVYQNGEALVGEGDTAETTAPALSDDSTEADADTVLTIPTFTVDTLSKYPDDLSEGEIKVYAYMLQKVGEKSAQETYSSAPAP